MPRSGLYKYPAPIHVLLILLPVRIDGYNDKLKIDLYGLTSEQRFTAAFLLIDTFPTCSQINRNSFVAGRSMSRPTPQPEYVFCGISGGASCCHYATVNGVNCCMIGSFTGHCRLYSIKTKKCITTLIDGDESSNSSIVSCGQRSDGRLWAHIRNVGVGIHKVLDGGDDLTSFALESSISTNHYGFCATDMNDLDQLAIPEEGQNRAPSVRIVDRDGATVSSFAIDGGPDAKRGAVMRIKWASANRLLGAFENGSLVMFEIATGNELARRDSLHKETILDLDYHIDSRIGVTSSATSPIHLWRIEEDDQITVVRSIEFPTSISQGCSAVAISPRGRLLAAGFWDGKLRVYATKSGKLLAVIDYHNTTISSLCWIPQPISEKLLLACACKDEKLTLWHMYDE